MWGGEELRCFFRPFDNAIGFAALCCFYVFFHTGIKAFLCTAEAVPIDMIKGLLLAMDRDAILIYQGEGGAADGIGYIQVLAEVTNEGSFTGPEVAGEGNNAMRSG